MVRCAILENYLERYGYSDHSNIDLPRFVPKAIVVIPCHDEGDISPVLQNIYHSYQKTTIETLVIVVINSAVGCAPNIIEQNQISKESVARFNDSIPAENNFNMWVIMADNLPVKDAGVGLARKIGMDEAVRVFLSSRFDGVIVCLDADSSCEANYLEVVTRDFVRNPGWDAASIHFEHPLEGFEDEIIQAIVEYELHLRVFISFQKWLKLPYAVHTIGSSMAVRASAYCRFGGMNKRKAGEDFYFLHKIADKGKVGEIRDTKIIPSPRISNRVPFGTGKAVGSRIARNQEILTYNPLIFETLWSLIKHVPSLYEQDWSNCIDLFHPITKDYLQNNNIQSVLTECKTNTSSYRAFEKRFFQWFNAFRLMKYLHYFREIKGFEDTNTLDAFRQLMQHLQGKNYEKISIDKRDALLWLRQMDTKTDEFTVS